MARRKRSSFDGVSLSWFGCRPFRPVVANWAGLSGFTVSCRRPLHSGSRQQGGCVRWGFHWGRDTLSGVGMTRPRKAAWKADRLDRDVNVVWFQPNIVWKRDSDRRGSGDRGFILRATVSCLFQPSNAFTRLAQLGLLSCAAPLRFQGAFSVSVG